MDAADGLLVLASQIYAFANLIDDLMGYGFKTDKQPDTTAAGRQIQELGIFHYAYGRLGHPFFLQRDHGLKKPFGEAGIAYDIVVNKNEQPFGKERISSKIRSRSFLRWALPKKALTEQKLQPTGQPRLVCTVWGMK